MIVVKKLARNRTYRLYKTHLIPEMYVKLNMDRSHRRVLAKFRSGSLPVHIETGRYSNPSKGLVNCAPKMIHFLMVCDAYSDLRRPFMLRAQTCNYRLQ